MPIQGFKEQVSDKWQDEPWEANKTLLANFLNDDRGSTLQTENDSIRDYFDELPIRMKELRLQIHNPNILLEAATKDVPEVDGFGKSWNTFYQDVKLIHNKTEIAVDSKTKTYLTDRVKILGDLSQTLSKAMEVYAQILHDKGMLNSVVVAK
ncbi:hypothetical protein M413DRAFT_122008 [Hebeloma cylindrosporum]|uniref:Uncharacterized protein n=1 Tax=Hebeloma cylindrosporum TaxID=76867 RepID=A0A0C3CES9_HEBCY|nr:hypothetical protein M413DRAFT_122008 [Hebeloma cylindrosporum h7]